MLLGEQRWREDLSFAKVVNEGASHTLLRQHPVCSSNKVQRSSERPPLLCTCRIIFRQGRHGEQWHGFCSRGFGGPSRGLCGREGGARSRVMNQEAGFHGERERQKKRIFSKICLTGRNGSVGIKDLNSDTLLFPVPYCEV